MTVQQATPPEVAPGPDTFWKTVKPRLISFAWMLVPVVLGLVLLRDREVTGVVLTVGLAGLAVNLASALLWEPITRHKIAAFMVPIALGSAFAYGASYAVRELRPEIADTEIQNVGAGLRFLVNFRTLRGEPWFVLYGSDAGKPFLGPLVDRGDGRWQGDVQLGRTDPEGTAEDCQFSYRLEVIQVAADDQHDVRRLFDKQEKGLHLTGTELSELPTVERVTLTRLKRACRNPNEFPIR